MQCAVIEFARDVCRLDGANSTEFDKNTTYPVIYLIEEWYDFRNKTVQRRDLSSDKGGTMRLGEYPCILEEDSLAFRAYGEKNINERHRHRYEFNNEYMEVLQKHGLKISGKSPDQQLVEIVEIEDHPWFFGCQFHPEFKSRPLDPHPVFKAFVGAAYKEKKLLFHNSNIDKMEVTNE
jgi:CTP synthase